MRIYEPSGHTASHTWPALLGTGLLGSLAVGMLYGFIANYLDLIVVFPILAGLGVGWVLKKGVRIGHCRNASMALLAGLIFGIFCYGVKHYTSYRMFHATVSEALVKDVVQSFRENLTKELTQSGNKKPVSDTEALKTYMKANNLKTDEELDAFLLKTVLKAESFNSVDEKIAAILTKLGGRPGFLGYMNHSLKQGISISSNAGSSSGGLNLGYWGSLILMLVEMAALVFFCGNTAASQLDEPYCEQCYRWVPVTWQRNIPPETLEPLNEVVQGITPDNPPPSGILHALPTGPESGARGKVLLNQCTNCRQGFLTAQLITPNADGKGESEENLWQNVILNEDATRLALSPAEPSSGASVENSPSETL